MLGPETSATRLAVKVRASQNTQQINLEVKTASTKAPSTMPRRQRIFVFATLQGG